MFSHSITGIRNSIALMEQAAYEASKGPKADIIKSQADMIRASNTMCANVAMLKAANQMHKSIIDILA